MRILVEVRASAENESESHELRQAYSWLRTSGVKIVEVDSRLLETPAEMRVAMSPGDASILLARLARKKKFEIYYYDGDDQQVGSEDVYVTDEAVASLVACAGAARRRAHYFSLKEIP